MLSSRRDFNGSRNSSVSAKSSLRVLPEANRHEHRPLLLLLKRGHADPTAEIERIEESYRVFSRAPHEHASHTD
jgi:hypothetical protein